MGKTLAKEKEYNQYISFRVFTPLHEYIDLQLSMKKVLMSTHANIINNLLECLSCLSCHWSYLLDINIAALDINIAALLELMCIKEFLVRCVCFMNCYIFVRLINLRAIVVLSQVNSILFLIILWFGSVRYHASVFPINCGFN